MPDELMTDAAEEADGVTRRAFVAMAVTLAGAAYAGAIGYPVYRYLSTPARRAATATAVSSVELPGAEKLPAGAAMMFKFGTRPAMLIHHKDGSWTSCTAVCTHLGCTVQYEADKERIHCACHGGVYDPKTGKNVSGPPPKPLQQYNVEVKDVQVIVTRA